MSWAGGFTSLAAISPCRLPTMNNHNFYDSDEPPFPNNGHSTVNGAYFTPHNRRDAPKGHGTPQSESAGDGDNVGPATSVPAPQMPTGAPPKAPVSPEFRMPLIEGDVYAPFPLPRDEKNKGALHWFPPPIKVGEVEPLAALLEKLGLHGDAAGLRLRAVPAEEARRELELLSGHLLKGLEKWSASAQQHNKELTPLWQYERQRLVKKEEAACEGHAIGASACTKARLPFPCDDVDAALKGLAPADETLCGAQGLVRLRLPQSTLGTDILACGGSGFLTLVVGLGPILNVFDLKMLDELSRTWPRLLIGTGLGAMIVWFLGAAVGQMVTQLGVRFLERKAGEPPGLARLAKVFVPLAIGAVLLLLCLSEITVGATGIHLTGQDHFAHLLRAAGEGDRARLLSGASLGELPWTLCAMIAVIVNAPYLSYKSWLTWNRIESSARADWCAHLRSQWLKEQWERPEVQDANAALGVARERERELTRQREVVQEMESRMLDLRLDLDDVSKQRLQDARNEAVGEADKLRPYTNDVARRLSQLQQRPGPVSGVPAKRGWWSRLWHGLFGPRRTLRPRTAPWQRSRP